MIDYVQIEMSAIREAFGESISALLCRWRMKGT
jgi:hypothetical protein